MKKVVCALLLVAGIAGVALFAQAAAADYVVVSVTGTVQREVSAGKWETVTKEMKLVPSTVIKTGINSTLVVKIGDRTATVKAVQTGAIDKLTAGTASTGTGIKLGAQVTTSDAAKATGPARSNVSTASTRAEGEKDLDWPKD